jgi:hypothetical protein
METDQHGDQHGGWMADRTSPTGRWIIDHLTPLVSDTAEHIASLLELLGPPSGGPPPGSDPTWIAACRDLASSDLQIVSLCRIERQRWVAHDGDGSVFGEVVLDHVRPLGTHEARFEMFVRVPPDQPDLQKRIESVLGVIDPIVAGVPEVGVPEVGAAEAEPAGSSIERFAQTLVEAAQAFESGSKSPGRRARLDVLHVAYRLDRLIETTLLIEEDPIPRRSLGLLMHTLDGGISSDRWVKAASRAEFDGFADWAVTERRRRTESIDQHLRMLVSHGELEQVQLSARSLIDRVHSADLDGVLERSHAEVVRRFLRSARRFIRDDGSGSIDLLTAFVKLTFDLAIVSGFNSGVRPQISDLINTCCQLLQAQRADEIALVDLRRTMESNPPSTSVVFEAAVAMERESARMARRRKKALKRIGQLRRLLADEPERMAGRPV